MAPEDREFLPVDGVINNILGIGNSSACTVQQPAERSARVCFALKLGKHAEWFPTCTACDGLALVNADEGSDM